MKRNYLLKKGLILCIVILVGASFSYTVSSIPAKTNLVTNKTILYENTALEVEIIEDFQANIRNIGSSAAVNIEWEIKFQAPFLFILPIKLNGNIDILQNQDVITIPPNPNIFIVGFGTLKQVVTVSADNANTVMDAEIIGFLFGTFIIIL